MAKQFIVKEECIKQVEDNVYEIISSEVKHMQVLRYNVSDSVIINNKIYEIVKMTKNSIFVKYISDCMIKKNDEIEVILYQAFLKNEMMDLTVKKAVELGVSKILPFFSSNVVVRLNDENDISKKKEKLEKIVIEAVKQCGRQDIPTILDFASLNELKNILNENDINIIAYEKEKRPLKDVIIDIKNKKSNIKKIGIIIGPEGGFREEEIEKLKDSCNLYMVSLGDRILRAETAAINLISIIKYEF